MSFTIYPTPNSPPQNRADQWSHTNNTDQIQEYDTPRGGVITIPPGHTAYGPMPFDDKGPAPHLIKLRESS